MSEKQFIIDLLIDSLKDCKSRRYTIDEIILILQKSDKIENNEEKLNAFLNLKCKNGWDGKILSIKECSKIRNLFCSLEDISKLIFVDNDKTLFDLYVERRDEKLIKSGKYKLLFIKNPLDDNEWNCRTLFKVLECDDLIKKELLSFGNYSDDYPSIYNFCFPNDAADNIGKDFLILQGEFQIWEGDNWNSWLINSHRYSQINNIYTTYVCDSEIIYPSNKEIVKYLFPEITHCLEGNESDGWIII